MTTNLRTLGVITLASCLWWATSCQWKSSQEKGEINKESNTKERQQTAKKEEIKTDKKLKFTTCNITQKSHIDNNSKLPCCTINIKLLYPSGGNTGNLTLKQLQHLYLTSLPEGMQESDNPQTAINRFVSNYIDNYQAEMEPFHRKAKRKENAWMNYEMHIKGENLYNENGFWGYSTEVYTYTGGAHGMTTTSYNVIDLKSGKMLCLNDLFAENDYNLINRMLRQQLADDIGIEVGKLSQKSYDAENIIADDNFMIGDMGITWIFNPYDIAPYSTGTTRITLPYRAIVGYLVPNSPLKRIAQK